MSENEAKKVRYPLQNMATHNKFKSLVRKYRKILFVSLPQPLKGSLRKIRIFFLRQLAELELMVFPQRRKKSYINAKKLYYINPEQIKFITDKEFFIYKNQGKVLGGDWDKLEKPFNQILFYKSYKKRVDKNTPWKKLKFYKTINTRIKKQGPMWGCKNEKELDKRCKKLDRIFKNIKKNGYKTQLDIKKNGDEVFLEDEITVNIGRHGDLLFNNGRHRLTFAKLANLKEIPVKITVRHLEWEKFKKLIEKLAKTHGGKVYAPITHIDLENIPSQYGHKRFDLIKDSLDIKKGTLLDIGANWGYFCHKFEDERFKCYAVENNSSNLYFSRKLKRAGNKKFKIISSSIFEFMTTRKSLKFDVVLALAVFHHFLKKKSTYSQLIRLLKKLEMKEMYFEPHRYKEPQMKNAYKNLKPNDFVKFILENSCLNNYKLIGKAEDGRPLFKIWK